MPAAGRADLKTPGRDRGTHAVMTPLESIQRLAEEAPTVVACFCAAREIPASRLVSADQLRLANVPNGRLRVLPLSIALPTTRRSR